jgi:hypothetical protein
VVIRILQLDLYTPQLVVRILHVPNLPMGDHGQILLPIHMDLRPLQNLLPHSPHLIPSHLTRLKLLNMDQGQGAAILLLPIRILLHTGLPLVLLKLPLRHTGHLKLLLAYAWPLYLQSCVLHLRIFAGSLFVY